MNETDERNWESSGDGVEHSLGWQLFQTLEVFFWNDVDEEIENLGIVNAGWDVTFLYDSQFTWRVLRLESSVKAQAR